MAPARRATRRALPDMPGQRQRALFVTRDRHPATTERTAADEDAPSARLALAEDQQLHRNGREQDERNDDAEDDL